MKRKMHKTIWIPRVVTIAFALFLLIFSLDVFGEYPTMGETILVFLMHSIPSLILLIFLLLSWRRPFFAGLLFSAAAITATLVFKTSQSIMTFMMLSAPLILIAILFFFAAYKQKEVTYQDR